MKVEINDEGKYGRSYYTDDPWAAERVYTWHDGKYDVKALVEEVGEWNEMSAPDVSGQSSQERQARKTLLTMLKTVAVWSATVPRGYVDEVCDPSARQLP